MPVPSLDLLKALGDDTRYAIYTYLAGLPAPRSTSDVAEALGLHPNTVRPHLERLREVGLLEVSIEVRSGVGRPQHLYALAADAPPVGLDRPAFPLLASQLVEVAVRAGAGAADAVEVGREQGRADARAWRDAPSCLEALVGSLDRLGFDPLVAGDESPVTGADAADRAVIAFAACPYRELAAEAPHLVCALHRGLVEGFVDEMGDATVDDFHDLAHRVPCRMTLSYG